MSERVRHVSERGTAGAAFAGTLLCLGGGLWLIQGLAGIVKGTSYNHLTDNWLTTDAATWGWVHLIGGVIALAAGFGVFTGATWARLLGVLIVSVSILVNFTFIPFAPWWAFTLILIDLWIIHSLLVHGRIEY